MITVVHSKHTRIIKATAQRIKSKYGKKSDDRIFNFIVEEVDRLNQILSGYLDFARPADNNRKAELVDMKDLLEELVHQCLPDLRKDQIEIKLIISKSKYLVNADKLGLRQAILNLIINSAEAYKKGGSIEIKLQKKSDIVKVKVIDYAGGIKNDILKNIYEPFATTKTSGSGLGLYVSLKIIENYKGRLSIKNNDVGGTTAEIILPRYKEN